MFTNSFAYPNLFNAATGQCNLKTDYDSILNRVGLLIQSYKKEEFLFPNFGTYFPDILLSYNTQAVIEKAKENIKAGIAEFEPFVDSKQIEITDLSDGSPNYVKLQVVLTLDKDFSEIAGTITWSWDENGGVKVS